MNVQTAMNGARMAAEVHGRLSLVPGFREFAGNVAILANLAMDFAAIGSAEYADKLMSAMRFEFGGHHEKPEETE